MTLRPQPLLQKFQMPRPSRLQDWIKTGCEAPLAIDRGQTRRLSEPRTLRYLCERFGTISFGSCDEFAAFV